jgi:hypothetical protein
MREHIYEAGSFHDVVMYSLLSHEWSNTKALLLASLSRYQHNDQDNDQDNDQHNDQDNDQHQDNGDDSLAYERWQKYSRFVGMANKITGSNMRIHFAPVPAEILEFLYLGDRTHASDPDLLASLGINHVLNVAPRAVMTTRFFYANSVTYHEIDMDDDETFDLLPLIPHALQFIDRCAADPTNNKVFVHCSAGVCGAINSSNTPTIGRLSQSLLCR